MSYTSKCPILGQEAVVPKYGVGRVVSFKKDSINDYIEVKPYISGIPMKFASKNVQLIRIIFEAYFSRR